MTLLLQKCHCVLGQYNVIVLLKKLLYCVYV